MLQTASIRHLRVVRLRRPTTPPRQERVRLARALQDTCRQAMKSYTSLRRR